MKGSPCDAYLLRNEDIMLRPWRDIFTTLSVPHHLTSQKYKYKVMKKYRHYAQNLGSMAQRLHQSKRPTQPYLQWSPMLPNVFENCIPTSPGMGSQEKKSIEIVEHGLKWLEYSCRIKPLELNPMLEEGYHPVDSGSKFIRIISHKGCFHGGDIDDAMQ